MANKLTDRLVAAYKAFSGGDWISSDLPGNVFSSGRSGRMHWVPGTAMNWDRLAGDMWMCPAVQACLNWIYRNFPQAPPIVEQKDDKGEWNALPNHPLVTLLTRPNPLYDGSIFFQGLILSLETNGNAYAIIERDKSGRVAELWYAPHHKITPYTAPDHDPRIVDYYDYWLGSKHYKLPPEDVLHLKYGLDPYDERLGLSPLASAARDVNALQQAGNYRPNILRNFGVVGRMVYPDDPNVTIDPKQIKDYIDANSQADNAGGTLVFDFKAGVMYPKTSPQDMALTTLEDRPEADICALIGIPIQVTGLHGGREAKTYANMKEAREAAWEEKLIPLGAMLSCQIGHRFLPEFNGTKSPADAEAYLATVRMNFDYDNIRPLQPDLDALHARALLDWTANLITLGQWYQMTKEHEPADLPDWETLKNQRYMDFTVQPVPPAPVAGGSVQDGKPEATTEPAEPKSDEDDGYSLKHLLPVEDWAERVNAELLAIAGSSAGNGNGRH